MKQQPRGFSLVEVLIALTLITVISFVVIGAVAPWLGMKQSMDTDRHLQDIRQGLTAFYEQNAMDAETQPGTSFFGFQTSTLDGAGYCVVQAAPFGQLKTLISDGGNSAAKDGYSNPWCLYVSPQLSAAVDGVTLYYRNVGIVSAGANGKPDAGTGMDGAGNMTFGGDDVGVLVSGFDIQKQKLKETMRRMARTGDIYESYFTTRFLAYADRDITRDYFYDGVVGNTNGAWGRISTVLGTIGVSPEDSVSAWEPSASVPDNNILVGNASEVMNGIQARSPLSTGMGSLPYTALLVARIPGPGTPYVTRVVVGGY
jgi:prepilin-type N-terminal cleavage/methylation domain-containing protein